MSSCFSLATPTLTTNPRSSKHILMHLSTQKSRYRNINKKQKSSATLELKGTTTLSSEKLEIFKSLEGWVEDNILSLLKPVESSWQPQDLLPNPSSEDIYEGIKEVRERSRGIPDEYYVCLVGNMITEEALPTYQTVFNTFQGVRDDSGVSMSPWARWTRKWTAEENRHGDVLNKYLYLTGRLDMRQIEKTIHYLIGSGMIIHTDGNPYRGFVYTSFQERATFISHGNTARLAKHHGDTTLAKICGLVAADEKRHELAYTTIVDKLFELDPDTTMLALAGMLRKTITMPAALMYDGQDPHLFQHYSAVAQHVGIYTVKDYCDNVEHFVKRWNVEGRSYGLSWEGREAQEYVCELPKRIRKMEERAEERKKKKGSDDSMAGFSWIFNKQIMLN